MPCLFCRPAFTSALVPLRWLCVLLATCAVSLLHSQAEEEPAYTVVASGLDSPWGLAVQPDTGSLFIAESGAGRIVRLGVVKVEPILVGAPIGPVELRSPRRLGPLSLAFQDRDTLLVGEGGLAEGEDLIRVFTPTAGTSPLDYKQTAKHRLGPLTQNGDFPADGNFFSVAVTKTAIYAMAGGANTKGWLAKAEINGSGYGPLVRHIATREKPASAAPAAVAIHPATGDLVVATGGSDGTPSELQFYNAKSEKRLLKLPMTLSQVAALAYSPKTGLLYATDFGGKDNPGGLYRLDASLPAGVLAIDAVRIAAIPTPTGLAFGKEGELFVASAADQNGKDKSGRVLKFAVGR